MRCFAEMDGLPIYGDRAKIHNVIVDDIITYRVKGRWVFSVVTGTTPTMIKVTDLNCENTQHSVKLYIKPEKSSTTFGLLNDTRRIFKVQNITYL